MREVTVYVAWDDEQFETEEECRRYEKQGIDAMRELIDCYEFDTGITQLSVMMDEDNLNNTIDEFEKAYARCTYINVKKIPSEDALRFIDYAVYEMDLPMEIGRYWYNFNGVKWEKVAD